MERCTLKLMFPSSVEGGIPMSSPDAMLQVWNIDAPRPLDFHHLSWKSRPQRNSLFTSWILQPNSTIESEEYHCSSGSFQTFELSCVGDDCKVDFRQSPKKKDLGKYYLSHRFL